MTQAVKNLPATQEMRVRSLSWEDPLKKGMATHSNILAWRIPRTEEPGGLCSMGSQSVGHNWVTNSVFLELWLFCLYITWWPLSLNIINRDVSMLFFSRPVEPGSLWPHGLQHSRPPCPSPSPEVCPSSCPLHRWCPPAVSSSAALFSVLLQTYYTATLSIWLCGFPIIHLIVSSCQKCKWFLILGPSK